MHPELVELRYSWYEAYIAGDLTRMASVESPEFVVVGPLGIETRADRLDAISNAVQAGRWFPRGSRAVDESLCWQAISSEVVTAFGVGRIDTPRGKVPRVRFTELWKRTGADWHVVQLHYSETGC